MILRDIQPAPELREYVYRYRLRHFHFNGAIIPSPKPFPPRPEQCLIFYPRGAERIEHPLTGIQMLRPRSVVSGQFTERVDRFITTKEFLMISIEFKPGVLYRFTGLNLSELTNKSIDAEAIFTASICDLNRRLSGSNDYEEMIGMIEAFLKARFAQPLKPFIAADSAMNELIYQTNLYTVDRFSKNAFLGARQLERKVLERTGVCPKTFLKLSRFHRSLMVRLSSPKLNWLSIAIDNGYSDYQHLAKDYKVFTNNTPNLFMAEELRSPGRALGLNH